MAGVAINIEPQGLKPLQVRLNRLGALGAADLRPLLEEIGEAGVAQTRQRFEDQAAPDGTPWEPSQRVLAKGGQILVDTARLKNSIGYQVDGGQVQIGTNVIYAAVHQAGGEPVGMNIKARAYLGLSEGDLDELEQIVDDFIERMIR